MTLCRTARRDLIPAVAPAYQSERRHAVELAAEVFGGASIVRKGPLAFGALLLDLSARADAPDGLFSAAGV